MAASNLLLGNSFQMLKPPKIVITNIDEDPAVRRDGRRKKIAEICGE